MFLATNTWHWVSLNVLSCVRDYPGFQQFMHGRKPSEFPKKKERTSKGVVAPPCPKQLSTQVRWGGGVSQRRLEPDSLFKLENIDIWLKTKPNRSLIGIRKNAFDPLKSAKKLLNYRSTKYQI